MSGQVLKAMLLTEDDELIHFPEFCYIPTLSLMIERPRYAVPSDEFLARIGALRPDILILGPDVEEDEILATASLMRAKHPEVECIAYQEASTELIWDGMRAGLRDIIDPGDGLDGLRKSIETLHQVMTMRFEQMLSHHGAEEQSGIVAVVAPKGGVGKSTIAVNLAYALAAQAPNDVVLVDLDLDAGDVGEMLQLESNSNVALAARSGAVNDPATLKLSLTGHPGGFLVLPAPPTLVEASEVDVDDLAELLELLGRLFKHVVIDTGPGAPDATIAAVKTCRDLLAVTTPDVGGLRSLERYLEALGAIGLEWPRTHYLLNRFDRRAGMTREDVEAVLGRPVDLLLNYDRHVPASANQGVPYLEQRPRGSLAGGFGELVDRLGAPIVATETTAKGWFR